MTNKIIAVLDDLFFTVKIMDAAKRAAMEVAFVKDETRFWELVQEQPALIIIDLNTKALNAVALIREIKGKQETRNICLLGFVSHVQIELKKEAQEAGADIVLPRSRFSTDLPEILQRHAIHSAKK